MSLIDNILAQGEKVAKGLEKTKMAFKIEKTVFFERKKEYILWVKRCNLFKGPSYTLNRLDICKYYFIFILFDVSCFTLFNVQCYFLSERSLEKTDLPTEMLPLHDD